MTSQPLEQRRAFTPSLYGKSDLSKIVCSISVQSTPVAVWVDGGRGRGVPPAQAPPGGSGRGVPTAQAPPLNLPSRVMAVIFLHQNGMFDIF